jgi:hypothetical protein
MSENLPLALDLIDKSTLNLCTNASSNTNSANCVNCTFSASTNQYVTLASTATTTANSLTSPVGNKLMKKSSSLNITQPLACTCNLTANLLTKKSPSNLATNPLGKQQTGLLQTKKSDLAGALSQTVTSLNNQVYGVSSSVDSQSAGLPHHTLITKLTRQPFHKRACFFKHNRKANAFLLDPNLTESNTTDTAADLALGSQKYYVNKIVKFHSSSQSNSKMIKTTTNSSGMTLTKLVKMKNGSIVDSDEADNNENMEDDMDSESDSDSDLLEAELDAINSDDADNSENSDLLENENAAYDPDSDIFTTNTRLYANGNDLDSDDSSEWPRKKSVSRKKTKMKSCVNRLPSDNLFLLDNLLNIEKELDKFDKDDNETGYGIKPLLEPSDYNFQYFEREQDDSLLDKDDDLGDQIGVIPSNTSGTVNRRVILPETSSSDSSRSTSDSSSSSADEDSHSGSSSSSSSHKMNDEGSAFGSDNDEYEASDEERVNGNFDSSDEENASKRLARKRSYLTNVTNKRKMSATGPVESDASNVRAAVTMPGLKMKRMDMLMFDENRENLMDNNGSDDERNADGDNDEDADKSFDNLYQYDQDTCK